MKIEQKNGFNKIKITLETVSDARVFWDMVTQLKPKDENTKGMSDYLSNWFSNEAQL